MGGRGQHLAGGWPGVAGSVGCVSRGARGWRTCPRAAVPVMDQEARSAAQCLSEEQVGCSRGSCSLCGVGHACAQVLSGGLCPLGLWPLVEDSPPVTIHAPWWCPAGVISLAVLVRQRLAGRGSFSSSSRAGSLPAGPSFASCCRLDVSMPLPLSQIVGELFARQTGLLFLLKVNTSKRIFTTLQGLY